MSVLRTFLQIGRPLGFGLRHGVALAVLVLVNGAVFTLAFLALLVAAIFGGGGWGGPLFYPVGALLIVVASVALGLFFCFPATALAGFLARRWNWPVFAQIPLSFALFTLLGGVLAMVAAEPSSPPAGAVEPGLLAPETAVGWLILFGIGWLELGLYWWVAQAGPVVAAVGRSVRGRFGAGGWIRPVAGAGRGSGLRTDRRV